MSGSGEHVEDGAAPGGDEAEGRRVGRRGRRGRGSGGGRCGKARGAGFGWTWSGALAWRRDRGVVDGSGLRLGCAGGAGEAVEAVQVEREREAAGDVLVGCDSVRVVGSWVEAIGESGRARVGAAGALDIALRRVADARGAGRRRGSGRWRRERRWDGMERFRAHLAVRGTNRVPCVGGGGGPIGAAVWRDVDRREGRGRERESPRRCGWSVVLARGDGRVVRGQRAADERS